VDAGNTVIVTENKLDEICSADSVIDLGKKGGGKARAPFGGGNDLGGARCDRTTRAGFFLYKGKQGISARQAGQCHHSKSDQGGGGTAIRNPE
jgi:hypothetical protein